MHEIVKEGKALIKIKKEEKISKKMEVFYNPVMKLNRDISILLLSCIDSNNMRIALPLAGSGVRGIRFLKELNKDKIRSISFNDYSEKAVKSINANLSLNKIKDKDKVSVFNEDANLFLLNSKGFDYIDIDPWGTSNFFLDAAVKRLSRRSILAVTNTDTAALTGTYPKACIRKYWALPKRDYMMHETGLRILIRKIQLIGMQYEKSLIPVFSYYREHYFRIFFQCIKGKKYVDEIAKQQGMHENTGPLWKGNLWDIKLAKNMLNATIKLKHHLDMDDEAIKLLRLIAEESKLNAIGFYDIHYIAKKEKLRTLMKKEDIIKKIRKNGFKASATHFSGTGIRCNAPYSYVDGLLKGNC
ncbi:hypothetical protein HYX01_00725 [Candidatus Woesearchaeota archaeon]|nr:hypothetical protein [Candidatus Woesearchaeota archaeon]